MTLHCQIALAVDIDQLSLELPGGLQLGVKIMVGLFLFGVALDTRAEDLRDVVRRPGVMATALVAQYAVAPGLALLLTLALDVRGSVAIGMLLVACCPAGNLSNLLTHRARGDVALSISLTGLSNLVALALTPLAFAFWCGLNPAAADLLRDVSIDPWTLVGEVALLIALPFTLGMLAAWRWPRMSARARSVVEPGALLLLLLVVAGGVAAQLDVLTDYVGFIAVPIVAHNALALGVGWATGRACRLSTAGVRAMTFELGVRNTALGVVLALAFFSDLGGVVLVAALWGLWDVVTGLVLATWWRGRKGSATHQVPGDAIVGP